MNLENWNSKHALVKMDASSNGLGKLQEDILFLRVEGLTSSNAEDLFELIRDSPNIVLLQIAGDYDRSLWSEIEKELSQTEFPLVQYQRNTKTWEIFKGIDENLSRDYSVYFQKLIVAALIKNVENKPWKAEIHQKDSQTLKAYLSVQANFEILTQGLQQAENHPIHQVCQALAERITSPLFTLPKVDAMKNAPGYNPGLQISDMSLPPQLDSSQLT